MRPHQLLQSRRHREWLYHATHVSTGALNRLPYDAHEAHSSPRAALCQAPSSSPWLDPKALEVPLETLRLCSSFQLGEARFSERGKRRCLCTLAYIYVWLL